MSRIGLVEILLKRGHHLVAHLVVSGVDHQDAIIAGLHGDIPAGSRNQINISLNVQRLDFHLREIRVHGQRHLARRPYRSCCCAEINAANPAETRTATVAKVEILRNIFFIVIVPVPRPVSLRLGLHLLALVQLPLRHVERLEPESRASRLPVVG